MIYVCSITPAIMYFHKHRKVMLSGGFFTKSNSYYDPQKATQFGTSGMNKGHHVKEIGARLFFGFLGGFVGSIFIFGARRQEEVADYDL